MNDGKIEKIKAENCLKRHEFICKVKLIARRGTTTFTKANYMNMLAVLIFFLTFALGIYYCCCRKKPEKDKNED